MLPSKRKSRASACTEKSSDQPKRIRASERTKRIYHFLFRGLSSGGEGVRALSLILCQRASQSRQLEAHASPVNFLRAASSVSSMACSPATAAFLSLHSR